jgi:hypothetical protein
MTTKKESLYLMQRDAFFAYLEFCEATNKAPEKMFYMAIYWEKDTGKLDTITCLIERQHGNYEKEMKKAAERTEQEKHSKVSFIKKVINYFK